MALDDQINSIRQTNGLLLYTLYRELQEVIAHDVVLPSIRTWPTKRFADLIAASRVACEEQYADFRSSLNNVPSSRIELEKLIGTHFEDLESTSPSNGTVSIDDILRQRLAELTDGLNTVFRFFTDPPLGIDGCTIGDVEAYCISDPHLHQQFVAVVSRLFWPVLFFRPPNGGACWTWPPERQFVVNRLQSMTKARRPNIYLPTVLPVFHDVQPLSLTVASDLALRITHQVGRSGNDQAIEGNRIRRLFSGVAAFDDRIIANYYDIRRQSEATRYDLLLGALSGIQLVIHGNEGTLQVSGLLVLCSPLIRFFHELTGVAIDDAAILCRKPPVGWEYELPTNPEQPHIWNRFGREVSLTARLLDANSDAGALKLFERIQKSFSSTNGPQILGNIATCYQVVADLISVEDEGQDADSSTRRSARQRLKTDINLHEFVPGESNAAKALRKQVRKAAAAESPIHIIGATGTGKDFVAKAIMALRGEDYYAFDCTQLKDCNSLQAQVALVGITRNSLRSVNIASNERGLFLLQNGRTVFLDEIQDLGDNAQSILKRILNNKRVTVYGDQTGQPVDFKLITATNRDIPSMIQSGGFQHDVWRRINGMRIEVPRLSERADDIPDLAKHFARTLGRTIADEAVAILRAHESDWPDNLGELNTIVSVAADFLAVESTEIGTNEVTTALCQHRSRLSSSDSPTVSRSEFDAPRDWDNPANEHITITSDSEVSPVSAKVPDGWQDKLEVQRTFLRKNHLWKEGDERSDEWFNEVLDAVKNAIPKSGTGITFDDLFKKEDLADYLKAHFAGLASAKTLWSSWIDGSPAWSKKIASLKRTEPGVRFIPNGGKKRLLFTEAERVIQLIHGNT